MEPWAKAIPPKRNSLWRFPNISQGATNFLKPLGFDYPVLLDSYDFREDRSMSSSLLDNSTDLRWDRATSSMASKISNPAATF